MSLFDVINTSSSGMVANRYWLDVIAGNIANANATRTADGGAYRRRMPVFAEALREAMAGDDWNPDTMGEDINMSVMDDMMDKTLTRPKSKGVNIMGVAEDPTPLKVVHMPGHPDADENGFVSMPNVNIVKEMVDMISANRAYDANVQITNAAKSMINKALEIGK